MSEEPWTCECGYMNNGPICTKCGELSPDCNEPLGKAKKITPDHVVKTIEDIRWKIKQHDLAAVKLKVLANHLAVDHAGGALFEVAGTCQSCGCTHDNCCFDQGGVPCGWTDDQQTLCSLCKGN